MQLPKRKLMRLTNYDYSKNGAYYVTICICDRKCLFGEIVGNGLDHSDRINPNGSIKLSYYGAIA